MQYHATEKNEQKACIIMQLNKASNIMQLKRASIKNKPINNMQHHATKKA